MKQIAKTPDITAKLRASFGPDANIDGLIIYEAVLATNEPIRKTGGFFQGAVMSPHLLMEMAASLNSESVPIRMEHVNSGQPFGRVFSAALLNGGSELRGLMAVDGTNHPDVTSKLDSGTIDMVSIGISNKHFNCSSCGFDFFADTDEALTALWTGEDPNGHTIGKNGVHGVLSGLNVFTEVSLVGAGAIKSARVVGPSESRLTPEQQQRLAASAQGGKNVLILSASSPSPDKEIPVDLKEFANSLEAAVTEKVTATVKLAAAEARVAELTAEVASLSAVQADAAKLAVSEAEVAVAVTALSAEAKLILTACGEADAKIPATIAELTALIAEKRTALSAILPKGGASQSADGQSEVPLVSLSAGHSFRMPRK